MGDPRFIEFTREFEVLVAFLQSSCPRWGRRAGVKTVRGAARPTPLFPWHLRPLVSLAPGPCLRVAHCCYEHAGQIWHSHRTPGQPRLHCTHARTRTELMQQPIEVEVDEDEQIVERVAAVDVAKASGMVCTRMPHESVPGKRVTKVWQVRSTTPGARGAGRSPALSGH
jgi:hypothetical protein